MEKNKNNQLFTGTTNEFHRFAMSQDRDIESIEYITKVHDQKKDSKHDDSKWEFIIKMQDVDENGRTPAYILLTDMFNTTLAPYDYYTLQHEVSLFLYYGSLPLKYTLQNGDYNASEIAQSKTTLTNALQWMTYFWNEETSQYTINYIAISSVIEAFPEALSMLDHVNQNVLFYARNINLIEKLTSHYNNDSDALKIKNTNGYNFIQNFIAKHMMPSEGHSAYEITKFVKAHTDLCSKNDIIEIITSSLSKSKISHMTMYEKEVDILKQENNISDFDIENYETSCIGKINELTI